MPPAFANLATPRVLMPRLWHLEPYRFPTLFPATRSRMPDYPLTMPGIERKSHVIGVQEISSLYLPHDLLRPYVPPCIPACIL